MPQARLKRNPAARAGSLYIWCRLDTARNALAFGGNRASWGFVKYTTVTKPVETALF